jgi:hypothetical protein
MKIKNGTNFYKKSEKSCIFLHFSLDKGDLGPDLLPPAADLCKDINNLTGHLNSGILAHSTRTYTSLRANITTEQTDSWCITHNDRIQSQNKGGPIRKLLFSIK